MDRIGLGLIKVDLDFGFDEAVSLTLSKRDWCGCGEKSCR